MSTWSNRIRTFLCELEMRTEQLLSLYYAEIVMKDLFFFSGYCLLIFSGVKRANWWLNISLASWYTNLHESINYIIYAKDILVELQQWCYLSYRDKRVYSFPKCINLNVNLMAWLEFERAYVEFAVQRFSHYNTGVLPLGNFMKTC